MVNTTTSNWKRDKQKVCHRWQPIVLRSVKLTRQLRLYLEQDRQPGLYLEQHSAQTPQKHISACKSSCIHYIKVISISGERPLLTMLFLWIYQYNVPRSILYEFFLFLGEFLPPTWGHSGALSTVPVALILHRRPPVSILHSFRCLNHSWVPERKSVKLGPISISLLTCVNTHLHSILCYCKSFPHWFHTPCPDQSSTTLKLIYGWPTRSNANDTIKSEFKDLRRHCSLNNQESDQNSWEPTRGPHCKENQGHKVWCSATILLWVTCSVPTFWSLVNFAGSRVSRAGRVSRLCAMDDSCLRSWGCIVNLTAVQAFFTCKMSTSW